MKTRSENFGRHTPPLDYFDASHPQKGSFPNLKPSLKSVSIRLPEDLLIELKNLANKKDVPYQSLLKIFLARQIAIERDYSSNPLKKRGTKWPASSIAPILIKTPKTSFGITIGLMMS